MGRVTLRHANSAIMFWIRSCPSQRIAQYIHKSMAVGHISAETPHSGSDHLLGNGGLSSSTRAIASQSPMAAQAVRTATTWNHTTCLAGDKRHDKKGDLLYPPIVAVVFAIQFGLRTCNNINAEGAKIGQ